MSNASKNAASRAPWPVSTRILLLGPIGAFACSLLALQAVAQTPLPPVVVTPPAPVAKKAAPKKAVRPPSKSVEPALALGTYNPALDVEGLTLPPGTTLTTAGPVLGYRALTAFSATKTATPIEQIPQSIQVIPKAVLDDQRPVSIADAVLNASNAQGPNNLGIDNYGTSPFTIRGFAADVYIDGLPTVYTTGNKDDLANVERIEVLKGPTALLYGGGLGAPIGGAVNIVSKMPTNVAGGEVGITAGSHGYLRSFFDVNQPLTSNGTVLFRMTGEYTGANSFIDVLQSKSYSINPTLTFTDKTDTTLTIQASTSKLSRQAYPGLPVVGTIAGDFRINPWMWPSDRNIHDSYSKRDALTVTFDRRLDPVWSFNVKARYSKSETLQDSQGAASGAPDPGTTSTFSLLNTSIYQTQEEFSINPNLRAKFSAGETKNTFLLGADYSRVRDDGYMHTNFFLFPPYQVNFLDPKFTTPFTTPDPSVPGYFSFFDSKSVYTTKGAYAQLQSTIWDRVHLLGGARLANLNVSYTESALVDPVFFTPLPPETFTVDKTKVLPRAGIVVDLIGGLSAYASYSQGMRWTASTQAKLVDPEESEQVEGGFKLKLGQQLSGTVSVFDIKRTNVPITAGFGIVDVSAQRSRGFEADVIWQPTSAWKFLAAYGHTDVVFSDSKTTFNGLPVLAGNKVPNVPEHSGRLWVDYSFESLKGLSAGAGIYAAAGQYVDPLNVYRTQSYFTVDSKIAYDAGSWKAALNVKNLTGEHYYVPYAWFGGQVAPGAPREFFGTLTYRF